ncbi:MAG: serine/threonine-protein kinase [Pyrinomonadaceae bacterium]
MEKKNWEKIKEVFQEAVDRPKSEIFDFIRERCGDDESVYEEVVKLVEAALDGDDDFMEESAEREHEDLLADEFSEPTRLSADTGRGPEFGPGQILAERYQIVGLVGRGGMGEVYRAVDTKLSQTVALKFLPARIENKSEMLARFIAEVRNARRVSHPNVCRVFDIGEDDGRHFISMEFIEGDDLSRLLKRIGRLPSDKATEIARQICFGLNAIHEEGMLHRDLKPANVIIDANGRARITDFGIAGFEEEITGLELRVGTPAYMSPEQITGREVSKQSDIYSLGLLLYEIYTGKKAFEGGSYEELLERHQSVQPTDPSTFVENLDPLVEKLIKRCLSKDPSKRPLSAVDAALALPGGDPLKMALEAGETPSPEMIAAAPKKGVLSPKLAIGLFVAFLIAFGTVIALNGPYKVIGLMPLEKSREVLDEDAKKISRDIGGGREPFFRASSFQFDSGYGAYKGKLKKEIRNWNILKNPQPAMMYFAYREFPEFISPQDSFVYSLSNPADLPGSTTIKLDISGKLLQYIADPEPHGRGMQEAEVDWNKLFGYAGLEMANFTSAKPSFVPPMYADDIREWSGPFPGPEDVKLRIEAASLRGKPTYFRVVAPWDEPVAVAATKSDRFDEAATMLTILIYILIVCIALYLAWRHIKSGRGDFRGAIRLAAFFFVLHFVAQFLIATHFPSITAELPVLSAITGYTLIRSFFVFLIYAALEPFVRRRWPELVISWSRVLRGEFKDPLVGRDILIGGIAGAVHALIINGASLFRDWQHGISATLSSDLATGALNSSGAAFGAFLEAILSAVRFMLIVLFLIVLLRVVFKKKLLAEIALATITCVLISLAFILGSSTFTPIFLVGAVLIGTLQAVTISRFGAVAHVVFYLVFFVVWTLPVVIDQNKFFFAESLMLCGLVLALATYGFVISRGGESIFGNDHEKPGLEV